MYECFIGLACFVCGVLLMFAVHRVIFDHYAAKAEAYIEQLKNEKKDKIEVEHIHTYAAPDDVFGLKFNDYLED